MRQEDHLETVTHKAETPDLVELRAKPDPEAHRRYRESVQVQQEEMGVR